MTTPAGTPVWFGLNAIATATGKDGTFIQGPDPIPGGDYSANITDPHGSQLGLVGPRKAA